MNESLTERPERHTVLRSFAGTIHAWPADVFEALVEQVRPDDQTQFFADPAERFAVVQGGWWYRAEYTVLEDDAGSRIEFELINVAQRAHWAGALTGRAVIRDSPAAFGALLTTLADRLE